MRRAATLLGLGAAVILTACTAAEGGQATPAAATATTATTTVTKPAPPAVTKTLPAPPAKTVTKPAPPPVTEHETETERVTETETQVETRTQEVPVPVTPEICRTAIRTSTKISGDLIAQKGWLLKALEAARIGDLDTGLTYLQEAHALDPGITAGQAAFDSQWKACFDGS